MLTNALYIDLFCGMGGSTQGITRAFERAGVNYDAHFVNHSEVAIKTHERNHRGKHYKEDLFLMDPAGVFPPGTEATLLWASPACTFFSLARGASGHTEQGRAHAKSVNTWIEHLRPECVMIENVRQFMDWGPLMQMRDQCGRLVWALGTKRCDVPRVDNENEAEEAKRMIAAGYNPFMIPDPTRKGDYFKSWMRSVEDLGYDSDWRMLCSADYGDATIRTRLIVQFIRRDTGKKIVWPAPTHSKDDPTLLPWRTAADVVDLRNTGKSIFLRKKPLAKATLRRQAIGLVRHGLKELLAATQARFILPKDAGWQCDYTRGIDSPLPTTQTTAVDSLCHAQMQIVDHMRRTSIGKPVNLPLPTMTAGGIHSALTTAFLNVIDNSGKAGDRQRTHSLAEPLRTLPTKNNCALSEVCAYPVRLRVADFSKDVVALAAAEGVDVDTARTFVEYLVDELRKKDVKAEPWVYVYYSNGSVGSAINKPLPTARTKEGTAVCFPVLEIEGEYILIDILYRMLTVEELAASMGFSEIDFGGAKQSEKIKMIGNSVSCGLAQALGESFITQNPYGYRTEEKSQERRR